MNSRFPSYPNVFQGAQDPRSQLIAQSITRQQLKQQSTGYLSGGSEFLDNSSVSSGQFGQLYQQQQQHSKMSTDRIRLSVHSPKESSGVSRQSKRPHSSASSNQLGVILNNQSTHSSVMQSFTSDRKPSASSNSANNSYCIGQENLSQRKLPQQQQQLIQPSAQSNKSLLGLGATLSRMTANDRNSLLVRKSSQPSYSQPFQLQQEQPTSAQTQKGIELSAKQHQSNNGLANRQMLSEQSQNVLTDESQATSIPNKPNKSLPASATATATARIASSLYGSQTNNINLAGLTALRPSQQLRNDNASALRQSNSITREQQSQQQQSITEQLNYKQQTYLNNLQLATAAVSLQQYSPEVIHVSPRQSQVIQQQQGEVIQQQQCFQNQRANQENNQGVLNTRLSQQLIKNSISTSPCISITNAPSTRTSQRNLGINNIIQNNDIQQHQNQQKSTNSLSSSPSVPRNALNLNESKNTSQSNNCVSVLAINNNNSNNQMTNTLLPPSQQQQSLLSGSIVVCQQPQNQLLTLNPQQLQQQQQQLQRQPPSNYTLGQPQQQSILNSLSVSSIQIPQNPSQQQSQLLQQQNETIQLKEQLHELTQKHQEALTKIDSMSVHQADLEKTIKLLIQQNELLSQTSFQKESQNIQQLKSQEEDRVVTQEADKTKKSQAQNEEQIAMLMSLEVRISELVAENERINNILADKEKQNSQYQLSSQILTSLIAEGQSEYRLKIQNLELEKLELRSEIRELRRKKEENHGSSALDLDSIVKGFEDKISSLVQENERLSELLITAVKL